MGSRLRVALALFGVLWIAILGVAWHAQPHSEIQAYAEGRGLGAALLGGLLLVGLNRANHELRNRKAKWRTRFPAAWAGAALGIAFDRWRAPVRTFPPEFDFSDLYGAPLMYFDSPFGTGALAVALFIQLSAFLVAASRHTYLDPQGPRV